MSTRVKYVFNSQAVTKWVERNSLEVTIGPVHHGVVGDIRNLWVVCVCVCERDRKSVV